jgi:hypothetical protein
VARGGRLPWPAVTLAVGGGAAACIPLVGDASLAHPLVLGGWGARLRRSGLRGFRGRAHRGNPHGGAHLCGPGRSALARLFGNRTWGRTRLGARTEVAPRARRARFASRTPAGVGGALAAATTLSQGPIPSGSRAWMRPLAGASAGSALQPGGLALQPGGQCLSRGVGASAGTQRRQAECSAPPRLRWERASRAISE